MQTILSGLARRCGISQRHMLICSSKQPCLPAPSMTNTMRAQILRVGVSGYAVRMYLLSVVHQLLTKMVGHEFMSIVPTPMDILSLYLLIRIDIFIMIIIRSWVSRSPTSIQCIMRPPLSYVSRVWSADLSSMVGISKPTEVVKPICQEIRLICLRVSLRCTRKQNIPVRFTWRSRLRKRMESVIS